MPLFAGYVQYWWSLAWPVVPVWELELEKSVPTAVWMLPPAATAGQLPVTAHIAPTKHGNEISRMFPQYSEMALHPNKAFLHFIKTLFYTG